jgi:hypothetical protein
MSAPGVAGQFVEVGNDPGAKRIQMNGAQKLQPIIFIVADDRRAAILKEVPGSIAAQGEGDGIAGQQPRQGLFGGQR